ncbi:hypothetical protein H0H93_009349 [Arthromyces matolae]|nr:hypothetical protein H0H93_009349 [Arthromyces matolae]
MEHGKLTYYDSWFRLLCAGSDSRERELQKLSELMLILTEWLTPAVPDLFTLKKRLS